MAETRGTRGRRGGRRSATPGGRCSTPRWGWRSSSPSSRSGPTTSSRRPSGRRATSSGPCSGSPRSGRCGSAVAALVRALRWRRARRWERMLRDPARAALVPPTEAHVDAVPEQPGGIKVVAKLVGLSLLAIGLVTYGAAGDVRRRPAAGVRQRRGRVAGGPDLRRPCSSCSAWSARGGPGARGGSVAPSSRLADGRSTRAGCQLHDADISPRRAEAIPPLDVTIIEEPAESREQSSGSPPRPTRSAIRRRRSCTCACSTTSKGTQRFLSGPWREYGYVHLLRSATSVTADELEAAQRARSGESLFITSEAELESGAGRPRRESPETAPGVAGRDGRVLGWIARRLRRRRATTAYPVYPARQLLCHDAIWKRVIDVLLARVDLVVLDLSGYHREHVGTGYELQRVVDRLPIERVRHARLGDERRAIPRGPGAGGVVADGGWFTERRHDAPLGADRLLGVRRRPQLAGAGPAATASARRSRAARSSPSPR